MASNQAVVNEMIEAVISEIDRISGQLARGSMNTATGAIQLAGCARRLEMLGVNRRTSR